jgi:hypothetical protein
MTTTSDLPSVARPRSRSLLWAGAGAIALTSVAAALGLLGRLPAIGGLMDRGGAVSAIAVLVVAISLWTVLFVLGRWMVDLRERVAIRVAREAIEAPVFAPTDNPSGRVRRRLSDAGLAQSRVGHRISAATVSAGNGPDATAVALSARSELDHAYVDVWYQPARALVWALPALGFLGTAAEMSRAIGGLGTSVAETAAYVELRNALVSRVIPPLADAFGATLLALGAAVVCHLLLTWIVSREQRTLLGIEEVILAVLARTPGSPPASPVTLGREMGALTDEMAQTRTALAALASSLAALDLSQLSYLQQLVPLTGSVQAMSQRVDQIHAELSRDIVVTRGGSPVVAGLR